MKLIFTILLLLIFSTLCERNIEIVNAGIEGNTSIDLLQRLNNDVMKKNPDLVLIMVGTNDMLNSDKLISYYEYKNKLIEIVNNLKQAQINAVLISPPPADTVYLFERHPRKKYTELPNEKLDSVRSILKNISQENNIGFIDIYNEFSNRGLPIHNIDNFIRNSNNCGVNDGVHPTEQGYQLIAETIFKYLVDNKLINSNLKIICFGDSITKGVHVKGEGTSIGDTYPAKLLLLIKNYVLKH